MIGRGRWSNPPGLLTLAIPSKEQNKMATYNSQTRSNYFPVKDREAFEKWCEKLGFELIDDDIEIDFFAELANHLQPDHVAIVMEVGTEGSRYLTGYAYAINSRGDMREISLYKIHDLAKELGQHFTA